MREPTVKAPPLPDKGYPLDRFYEQKLNPPQTDVKPPACSEIDTDHAVSLRQLPARTWNGGLRGHFLPRRRGAIRAKVCAGTGILEPRGHFLPRRRGGNQGQSVCRNGDPGAAGALFAPQKGGQSGPKCVQERGSWSRGGTFCPAEGGAIRAKVCAGTGILEPRGHFLPRRRGGNQGQSVCRNGDPGAAGALFAPQKGGAIRAKMCAGTDTMSIAATWRFWNGCGLVQKTIIPLHHAPALREPDWRRPATFLFEESPNHTNYISTIVHVNSCSTQAL